ncbi:hypothetical protein ABT369_39155 [Dactylosporangium sp. NPDC000244]|uniref:hypothetical protein n=1 Tax=Dactylosporangium sp. NPDC000244 TaxID=3154365 RepID=UPI00332F887E
MTRTPEPAGPPQWTPGAGWERVNREIPQYVPELTDEDMRWAAEVHAAAERQDGREQHAA